MSNIVLVVPVSSVTVNQGRAVATATVTNRGTAVESVVLGAFRPLPGPTGADVAPAVAWTTVERPQRDLDPGATEQFTLTFAPPADAAAGTYAVRFLAYPAYGAPEEGADQARQVEVVVPAAAVPPPPPSRWWIYAIAAALVVVVAVVAFLLLRPGPECPDGSCPSPSPSPTPTLTPTPTPVVIDGITWRVTGIRQGDAVTLPLTKNLTLRVEGDRVSGSDGCNSYSGTWAQTGDTVQVSNLSSTRKLCFPVQLNDQARLYLRVLGDAATVRSDGTTLELLTDDNRAVTFARS